MAKNILPTAVGITDAAYWDDLTAPTDDDVLVIADGSNNLTASGKNDLSAKSLAMVHVLRTFGGNLGSASDPFAFNLNPSSGTGELLIEGSGRAGFFAGGASTPTYDLVNFHPAGRMEASFSAVDIAKFYATRGFVRIRPTCTDGGSGEWVFNGCDVDIEAHATDVLTKLILGGAPGSFGPVVATRASVARDYTQIDVNAYATAAIDLNISGATGGTVNVRGGTARFIRGSLAALNADAGIVDFSEAKAPLTVAAFSAKPGVRVIKKVGGPTITFTADNSPTVAAGARKGWTLVMVP